MNRQVALYPCKRENSIDLVEYLKRYGEHLLAVKVVKCRKGQLKWDEISSDIMEVIHENEDVLINGEA